MSTKAPRHTNPIDPRYNLQGDKGYGQIKGSKTFLRNNGQPLRQNNSLVTNDIRGAQPKVNNFVIETKEDIPGTKANSLKRGISSNRKTDPLQPKYDYPGCKESNTRPVNYSRPKTAVQRFDAFIK